MWRPLLGQIRGLLLLWMFGVSVAIPALTQSISFPIQSHDFGQAGVSGGSPVTASITYSGSGSTAPSFSLAFGKEFRVTNSNCSVSSGITCSVSVAFTPLSTGVRQDALLESTSNGTLIGTVLLHGIGTSPQTVVYPGVITTAAGTGIWGYFGDGGLATSATMRNPQAVTIDPAGSVYVADSVNQVVRKINTVTGLITTVAGNGISGYSGDAGPATIASLNNPTGVALDGAGNLYIADNGNNLVRVVMAGSGNIYTVAGGGKTRSGSDGLGDGGPATSAILYGPTSVAVDASGNIFIADSWHSLIRRVDPSSGIVSGFAGGGTGGGTDALGDGGAATNAILLNPQGIALDSAGNVYIADTGHSLIRRVAAGSGIITAVAGNGSSGYSGDSSLATSAELNAPTGVRLDAAGDLYIADFGNNVIRKVTARSQTITTLAGGVPGYGGDGGSPLSAQLNNPSDLALDNSGNLYIADYSNNVIRKLAPTPQQLTFPTTLIGEASVPQSIAAFNIGNQAGSFTSLAVSPNFAQIKSGGIDCSTATPVPPGSGCLAAISFTPTSSGTLTGNLLITGSPLAPLSSTLTTPLSGLAQSGSTPNLSLSPTSLSFTGQLVNTASAPQSITLSNTGSATLGISAIWISGPNATDFAVTTTCQNVLAVGAACTATLTFTPQAAGNRSGSLMIVDSLANSPQSVQLTGAGVALAPNLALNPTSISFSSQVVGTNSSQQVITLSNTGTAPLNISSISIGGTNTADFTLTTSCPGALAAASSCTASITFSPQAAGPRVASVMIADSLANSPQSITLSGTGTGPSGPALQQIPGSLHQISVGSDGTVWGVNNAGLIYTYNSQTGTWQQCAGVLAQVAAAPNGYVWGLTAAGYIYQYNPSTQAWQNIPGNLAHIAVGADGDVWGLNNGGLIYHFNTVTQGWDNIPGLFSQIAVGFDGAVWGLSPGGSIYRFNVGSRAFEQLPGQLVQIAVGGDGDVWGLNSGSQIYHFNSLAQNWEQVAGNLTQISVGSATRVWGVNAAGGVYHFDNPSQSWVLIQGNLGQISVGANGAVWGLDPSGNVYNFLQYVQPANSWHALPGALAQVKIAPDGDMWGLSSTNQIWHFNRLLHNWEQVPGLLAQLAIGFGGEVWGLNSAGSIYRYSSATENWQQVPGLLAQIAVGANRDVWGINSAGLVFRFDRTTQNWDQVGEQLAQISVGADGTAWGLTGTGQILRYDPQAASWDALPGVLSQIAVGSSQNVWGINPAGNVYRFDQQTQNWDAVPGVLTYIGVAFDGAVWGVNGANQAYRFNTQAEVWQNTTPAMVQVSVSSDLAIGGLATGGTPYRFQ